MPIRPGTPLRYRRAGEHVPMTNTDTTGQVNLLTLMFRRIKSNVNMNPSLWSNRMNVYLKDPRNNVLQTSRGRSSERSNLNRGLTHAEMTTMNFMKALRVLRPLHVRFIFMLEDQDGELHCFSEDIDEVDLYLPYHNAKYPDRKNAFSRLFDVIRKRMVPDESDWNKRFKFYLEDPVNGFLSGTKRSSERGNLNRGLSNPNMSSKNFTKGLKVINPKKIYFTVELHFSETQHSIHEVVMDGNHLNAQGEDNHEE